MRLVLLGAPGAGKGTQAKLLAEKFRVPHISTGDMFRAAASADTPIGREAQTFMQAGALVPDNVVVGLVKERLVQEDAKNGFLLDGFPRTVIQANALEEMLRASGQKLDSVVNIDVSEQELIARLSSRRTCRKCGAIYNLIFETQKPKKEGVCDRCGGELYQRSDERPDVIGERLRVYTTNTAPLVDYYRRKGLLKQVVASNSMTPKDVFAAVLTALGA
ncbi:adenylate kinase [Candidatus Micrarchaeota archaeon]|nr:adenylate kinase [Candidatus Micrarchaeota archaeon]